MSRPCTRWAWEEPWAGALVPTGGPLRSTFPRPPVHPKRDRWLTIGQAPQTITFTSTPPASPAHGSTYTVSATGGGSGNPVTFGISSAG